jgi:hypothetical protein
MKKELIKGLISYTIATILLWLIAYIYTLFGHGVHSNAMTYMFLYPLIGGLLFLFIHLFLLNKSSKKVKSWLYTLLHMSVATLSMGSFLKGVLDIAGTGSFFIQWFYYIGYILIFTLLILSLRSKALAKRL